MDSHLSLLDQKLSQLIALLDRQKVSYQSQKINWSPGSMLLITVFVPQVKDALKEGGRVVDVSSIAGIAGNRGQTNYGTSKAGVIALTKSLGKELAQTNIRVHALAPAAIETELLTQMSPEHVQIMIDKSPMKRLGTVREVSHQAAWLCSDACSFSTGATRRCRSPSWSSRA